MAMFGLMSTAGWRAKAHEGAIAGKDAAAFYRQGYSLCVGDGSVDALFIFAIAFTAEGSDYLTFSRRQERVTNANS